jgi:two-component system, OmpR family, phosphate regulon sensor histidine kinase PhoR
MGRIGTRERALSVGGGLLFTEEPDARSLQVAFTLLLALDLTLRKLGGASFGLTSWPTLGAVIGVGALLVAWLVPWRRTPAWAVAVLPGLDMAAVGLSRLDVQPGGAAFLAVVPALWLGRQFGRAGALVATLAAVVLIAVPGLAYLGVTGATISRSLFVPVMAAWAALAIALALERLRGSLVVAEQGRVDLAEALETIEHQRRVAEAILDTVDVGLVLLDRHGTYQSMNRRHREFMAVGYPDGHDGRAGQLGLVFAEDGTTPLTREEMPTYRASQGEEFDDSRLWIGADPLSRRALSVSARAVRTDDGIFAGAALAYKDVTDFMRALRVKDEFVASVSHELRTPLTSITGYVDLLLEREDLDPEVLSQLEVVERNSARLGRLVADLLSTAQSDQGAMPLMRTRTDLAGIVRNSVEAARPVARAAGIAVECEVAEDLEMLVDAQRMAQVADNLVSNAIKYSRAGGRVGVRLGRDGARVELAVSDTGIGIDPADRDRLFTRFFRAREAEERSIQGVGLGLSITKAIVEGHGGRIEVESEPGRGSTFRVRLPVQS